MNRKILIGTFAILALLLIFYLISDSQKVGNTFRTTTPTFTEISKEQATISAFETRIAEYPSICKNLSLEMDEAAQHVR